MIFAEKASIKITPKQNSKHVGETLDLTTVVTGNPLPASITLEKQDAQTGVYVDYPKTKYSVTSLNSVSIHELSLEDSGQYRACVDNSHSSIECDTFNIIVTGNHGINVTLVFVCSDNTSHSFCINHSVERCRG